MSKKYLMHVISGTHWDREWRHTAEQSKLRLCDLIDRIQELMETHPGHKSFCLDGGMVVLEDYLGVRPERKERLGQLVKAGKIELVNWYTLPETFTVAPEALIRNLLMGTRMAEELGGAMKSGYTATSYGQTSQLPQIYRGFDIPTAMFYRGTNKHQLPSLFLWESPDGSCIHTVRTFDEVTRTNWFFYVHQPLVCRKPERDLSYRYNRKEVPAHLADMRLYERALTLMREEPWFDKDPEKLNTAMRCIMNQALPYAVGKHILALNIEDNQAPFELMPEMIDALNEVSNDVEIVQSTMDEYFDQIIADSDDNDLFVHAGELRYPAIEPGFNALLGATHSSRIKLKVLNDACETLLMNIAEPLASFACLYGAEYPVAVLDTAWRYLLQNQAHDSICGAAVDQAHEDMLYRFSVAGTVGQEVAARSALQLFGRIHSQQAFQETDYVLTFFNTLAYDRKEVIPVVVDLPRDSSGGVDPVTGIGKTEKPVEYFDILDTDGNRLAYEVLSEEAIELSVESHLDTNGIKGPFTRRWMLVEASVPAMGYATYALRPREPEYVTNPQPGPDRALIARASGVLENEYLKVNINPNGTFDLTHKETLRTMPNLHYFTNGGEVGNAHLRRRPMRDSIQTSHGAVAEITMVESNLLRGVFRIDVTLKVPAGATQDERDRLREMKEVPIRYWITLEKDSKYVKIRTKLRNECRDHRLQVHFPTGVNTDYATVESAFSVERRCVRWTEYKDNYEAFYPFQPMQNFVDLNDGGFGLAFLSQGLREYEVQDDSVRTLSITLLRTQRAYMTANTDMTPEEFDRYTGLHSFGQLEYEYALYPHTGDWREGEVFRKAYENKVDIRVVQSVPMDGTLPVRGSFLTIHPTDKLAISAVKRAQDGGGIVVRLWNKTSENVDGVLSTLLPIRSASLITLNEKFVSELSIDAGKICLDVAPHKIVTVLLQP